MEYQNHLVDPTYFWDAIEEFSFDYTIYVVTDNSIIDDYGIRHESFSKQTIRGSLQSEGLTLVPSKEGNTHVRTYGFYCKSLYRINIGDVIEYKNEYLRCDSLTNDYDEYGVRAAKLTAIELTQYRDFADYLAYINGGKLV